MNARLTRREVIIPKFSLKYEGKKMNRKKDLRKYDENIFLFTFLLKKRGLEGLIGLEVGSRGHRGPKENFKGLYRV